MLEVVGLSKSYRSGAKVTHAIERLDFAVEEHEFVGIVGPSGAGKTTLLKCIAGLLEPTSGQTLLRGAVVTAPPPELAVVFQDYSRSLFPWLTVRRNVELPLRHKGVADKGAAASEALAAVGLAGFESHYPWQLSGGMQQRVAIARALAYQPKVLLMDEPFASVDAQTRAELEDLVLRVREQFGVTIVLVTHDIDEAVYMSDRVVVLSRPPSTVREILPVELPLPRDQIETKALPAFASLRARVYEEIMQGQAKAPAA
ncbi:ABC transporter ATP-binding protein [Conexibacter sp. JD483]|uniref:ABC transporter ATP-binding protein n=1 Tax=unclassified Conexibacter TaxID=2627773 RepID=UPI00271CDFBE|nr:MULTISPECIES: ABC transporter ATP-binding protein [unclassified Conexibacter]MDO8186019.1 ABC transporter ATP-binding protein [Conexibacter sp. CPCC 205706]MDO8199509.1 ABC transporter ATP-binding protein [Conexibacter sp. CPCC 205762]MDR9368956.1 ABC transporter ATP-binding protein [Conexibacter sp. JD483]